MPGQGNNTVPNVVADRPTVINGFAGTSRCSVIAISIFAGSVSWLQSNRINKSVVQCESKRIAGIKSVSTSRPVQQRQCTIYAADS